MRRSLRCCAVILLFVAAGLSGAAPALAEPSAADKETARSLLIEGRAKLAAGDAQAALKAFQAAHAIMGVPTTGLDVAKANVALGQLVEARDMALNITRIPVKPGESEAFAEARTEADKLANELAGRIPSLLIHVQGPPSDAVVSVRVDGAEIPSATLSVPRKVNPGSHMVEASSSGFGTEQRAVTVAEKETAPVEIQLSALAPALAPASTPQPVEPVTPGGVAQANEGAGRSTTGWAWGMGAAGLAALGVGAAFMVDFLNVRKTVAADCPAGLCDPKRYDQADADALRARWNRDIGLAVGLGAVGLVGLGTGIGGLLTAKGTGASAGSAVMPWISPGGAGATVQGVF
jgi:hypothetical protein